MYVRKRGAQRRDIAEPAIVHALRDAGAFVRPLTGSGLPDLLVLWRGHVYLMEIKDPPGPRGGDSGRRLRPGQQLFVELARTAGVTVHVVHSPGEALAAIERTIIARR